jgi:hypothetical protein
MRFGKMEVGNLRVPCRWGLCVWRCFVESFTQLAGWPYGQSSCKNKPMEGNMTQWRQWVDTHIHIYNLNVIMYATGKFARYYYFFKSVFRGWANSGSSIFRKFRKLAKKNCKNRKKIAESFLQGPLQFPHGFRFDLEVIWFFQNFFVVCT